jgi:hypothetical protein
VADKVVINLATGLEDRELLVCPICFDARKLDEGALVGNTRLAGATPLWEWIGEDTPTVFSY